MYFVLSFVPLSYHVSNGRSQPSRPLRIVRSTHRGPTFRLPGVEMSGNIYKYIDLHLGPQFRISKPSKFLNHFSAYKLNHLIN